MALHLFAGLGLSGGAAAHTTLSASPLRGGSAGRGGGVGTAASGRASSAPRSASAKARALAKAVLEAQSCNTRAVSTSRRRLRRYENSQQMVTEKTDSLAIEEEENRQFMYGVYVDIRSAFANLFDENNREELELFRNCGERAALSSSSVRNKAQLHHHKWLSISEAAWMQCEKRLRSIVRRAVLAQPELKDYVQALEFLLVYVSLLGDLPSLSSTPEALLLMLEGDSVMQFNGATGKDGREKRLTIPLKDSSFHRLLLHAIAQFYGLRSKTISGSSGTGGGSKSKSKSKLKKGKLTTISFPAKASAALQTRASLWAFLALLPGENVELGDAEVNEGKVGSTSHRGSKLRAGDTETDTETTETETEIETGLGLE